MDDEHLIETLLKQLSEQNDMEQTEKTFLEVIDKHSNEEYVSKILAYILENNPALCAVLINDYFRKTKNLDLDLQGLSIDRVACEENMIYGRADIFVEASLDDGTKYTVTVENKIYSFENGEQTSRYRKFVEESYPLSTNVFIYLKPDFNASEPKDKGFSVLTYRELLDFLRQYVEENSIAKDFQNHIAKYFIKNSGDIMDIDRTVLLNYDALKGILKNAKNKYDEYRNKLGDEILKGKLIFDDEIPDYRTVSEEGRYVSDVTSPVFFRIFKQGVWRKDGEDVPDIDKYFFYIETALYDMPLEISTRIVVRAYGKKPSNSKVYRFMTEKGAKSLDRWWLACCGEGPAKSKWEDKLHYYVFDPRGDFKSSHEILDEKWTHDLQEHIKISMREYSKCVDALFEEFTKYIQNE